MKRLITICAVVGMVFAVSSVANATLYVETFDSDSAGWKSLTQSGVVLDTSYSSTGGNPGGYISQLLTSEPTGDLVASFQPTDAYHGTNGPLGPWSDMTGETMTADFKIDGAVAYPEDNPMVRFYIGSKGTNVTYWMTKDAYSWNPNGDTEWANHQVELVESNFDCMLGADNFTFSVANALDIGLQFGPSVGVQWQSGTGNASLGFAGTDTTVMLDNFGTVPEPATVALLGLGSLGLIRARRKTKA